MRKAGTSWGEDGLGDEIRERGSWREEEAGDLGLGATGTEADIEEAALLTDDVESKEYAADVVSGGHKGSGDDETDRVDKEEQDVDGCEEQEEEEEEEEYDDEDDKEGSVANVANGGDKGGAVAGLEEQAEQEETGHDEDDDDKEDV